MANHDSNLHEFDVFLSFRGSDTRLRFTDHLYAALERAGIRTFRDDEELERGESLNPQLEKAIKNSGASIIVFSENYASSQWCLDELVMILERKRSSSGYYKVLPVFYHIEPCDVRYQRESFEKAFKHHVEKAFKHCDQKAKFEKLKKIEAWKIALGEAAEYSGIHITTTNGYETTFIGEIVDDIKKKLPVILDLPKYLVGIDGRVKYINDWIRDGTSNNNILVIWGFGGIGKTTIAKYAYTSNIRYFKAGSYLENIGQVCDQLPKEMLSFQCQLLLDLCGKKGNIRNRSEGIEMIKKALCNKTPSEKYLIILDDVTKRDQIEALLEPLNVCSNKKIIITTRDKSLLNGLQVKLHEVEHLTDTDATALFKSHAFHPDHSTEDFMNLSQQMIRHCGNLPLALKVLGSTLLEAEIDEWEETLQRLGEVADPNIHNVLKISYDSLLDDKIKKLFLRIACLFIGEKKDFVIKVLDPCALYPKTGIKTLCDKS